MIVLNSLCSFHSKLIISAIRTFQSLKSVHIVDKEANEDLINSVNMKINRGIPENVHVIFQKYETRDIGLNLSLII